MSLPEVIRFNHLSQQLTNTETTRFISQLCAGNSDLIIKSLSTQFLLQKDNEQNEAKKANKLISNLIQNRSKQEQPEQSELKSQKNKLKLNDLPKELIGIAASFLNNVDYFDLCKTNRYLYLCCRSIITLQHLSLYINEPIPIQSSPMPQLKSIKLSYKWSKQDEEQSPKLNFNEFLSQKVFNFNNITKLSLSGQIPIQWDQFKKLINSCPQIQYLRLDRLPNSFNDIDIEELKKLSLPNLKGLEMENDEGYDFVPAFIELVGPQLEYLYFDTAENSYCVYVALSNVNFSKLTKFEAWGINDDTLQEILITAVNLRKFSLFTQPNDQNVDHIMNMIKFCKEIEYIELEIYMERLKEMMEAVKTGLFHTRQLKRNRLTIKMRTERWNDSEYRDDEFRIKILLEIVAIINLLSASKINHFEFICNYDWCLDKQYQSHQTMNGLREILTNCEMIEKKNNFVIKSERCNIINVL